MEFRFVLQFFYAIFSYQEIKPVFNAIHSNHRVHQKKKKKFMRTQKYFHVLLFFLDYSADLSRLKLLIKVLFVFRF